ncbi:hypothetical protein B0O99DRAFT_606296 [Bisporella sp. PMI_857]|nr:hypothetical protein B0O99DRAFT_606296 [Bisporella sp. PMI_857]
MRLMDYFLFQQYLKEFTVIEESTTCFEVFLQADKSNTHVTEESSLPDIDIDDFLQRSGRFERKAHKNASGIRLILQRNVVDRETFEPKRLSMQKGTYQKIIREMHLPFSWIETSSAVGPFFWYGIASDSQSSYIQIIYRKSDVKKKATPRNWELVLSFDVSTGITSGFFKGTSRSDIAMCLDCLKNCVAEIEHPMFLPLLIFSYDADSKEDKRLRDNRERVRILEGDITRAAHIFKDEDFTKRDTVNLAQMNSDLVDCHKEVLWKRPEGYLAILHSMGQALSGFKEVCPSERKEQLEATHCILERRLKMLKAKLEGISTHRQVTISRLELIERVLQNLVSLSIFRQEQQMKLGKLRRQQTAKMEKSWDQERRDMHQAQNEFENMVEARKQTAIGFLGALFLPGTFLASVFSTSFFDFQAGSAAGIISKKVWIYWAFTLPITIVLLALLAFWQRWLHRLGKKRDAQLRVAEAEGKREREMLTQSLRNIDLHEIA